MPTNSSISKLRQNFKAARLALDGLSPPHRRLVWLGGGGVLLLLFYLAVVNPLLNLEDEWSQELASRSRVLSQYQKLLQSKTQVAEANKAMKATLARTEAQFLSGANPAVASADLQEILKNLAKEQGVQMSSTKVLPPREAGPYLEVPVQVQLSASLSQLVSLLYHLEHHKKLLFIPDLEINAPRWVKGDKDKSEPPLQVSLVISGVIKKGVSS
jgi:type II secretory pathway component PulM